VKAQTHESLTSFRRVSASSERKFGVTVGAILVLLAVWPLIRHHQPVRLWLLALGAVLVVLGLAMPRLLAPLNRLWFGLGLALARVTNPIVMGVMFFAVVVPLGWLLRRQGKDLLRLKRDHDAASYWIARDPAAPTSLAKQF
jgi:hypothetical protein